MPTFQGGNSHRNDYLVTSVSLSFYRAQMPGAYWITGDFCLLFSPSLFFSHLPFSCLYFWLVQKILYCMHGSGSLVMHSYPGCFDQFGVLGHTSWRLILVWIPMMSSMGSVGANLNLSNQSCWVPGSLTLITHFNTLPLLPPLPTLAICHSTES